MSIAPATVLPISTKKLFTAQAILLGLFNTSLSFLAMFEAVSLSVSCFQIVDCHNFTHFCGVSLKYSNHHESKVS